MFVSMYTVKRKVIDNLQKNPNHPYKANKQALKTNQNITNLIQITGFHRGIYVVINTP